MLACRVRTTRIAAATRITRRIAPTDCRWFARIPPTEVSSLAFFRPLTPLLDTCEYAFEMISSTLRFGQGVVSSFLPVRSSTFVSLSDGRNRARCEAVEVEEAARDHGQERCENTRFHVSSPRFSAHSFLLQGSGGIVEQERRRVQGLRRRALRALGEIDASSGAVREGRPIRLLYCRWGRFGH